MSEYSPKQTEYTVLPEVTPQSPEYGQQKAIGLINYIDVLSAIGEEDQSDRHHGLMIDLGERRILNDNSLLLEDISKLHLGPDTNKDAVKAIKSAAEYAQASFQEFIDDMLNDYRGIDFSCGHIQVLADAQFVPVTGVDVEWDTTKSTVTLVATTESGRLTNIARSRLRVDITKVPERFRIAVKQQVRLDEL